MSGLAAKQLGLELVSRHNEHFLTVMRAEAERIAQQQGRVSVDELRVIARRRGLEPEHRNAWGAVFLGSKWRPAGHKHSVIPSNRHRRINLWRLA